CDLYDNGFSQAAHDRSWLQHRLHLIWFGFGAVAGDRIARSAFAGERLALGQTHRGSAERKNARAAASDPTLTKLHATGFAHSTASDGLQTSLIQNALRKTNVARRFQLIPARYPRPQN
ncbi:MAG: hypothetical protein AAGF68_02530, partial [Pseudomonadota bacterium]